MHIAKRLQQIGAYLFADLDRKQAELTGKGVDVISLSVGDPDLPTPAHIVDAMMEGVSDARTHRYPPYAGTKEFREAAAGWFRRRFGVSVDPATEVLALIGSKEGLAHLPWATLDPGDVALIPDPGYPVYRSSTILADGVPYAFPLTREHGFLPDLGAIPPDVLQKARLLFLNYPNNPTGATAPIEFFADAVVFAKRWNLLLVHDNAYSEIGFDGYKAPSVLEVDGAKDIAIEFHSLSKTFCMTGWRVGFAAGNAEAIKALATIKTNIDSGVFRAIQQAGIAGLTGSREPLDERLRVFQNRRDRVLSALKRIGWDVPEVKATLYVWLPVPGGSSSAEFATEVLEKTGVLITPGAGYGKHGEGYVRLSLTLADDRLDEALERLENAFGPAARIPSASRGSAQS